MGKTMNILGQYKNGNYSVTIYDDGTKIRENDLDNFEASFPECMDVKITDFCDMNCPYCHENSSLQGKRGDILSPKFLNTLRPFTEIAIGGGNPLAHSDLIPFLELLKSKNIVANITVNQAHFMRDQAFLRELVDKKLVRGVGVSLVKPNPEFISLLSGYPNAVIHVINGIVDIKDLNSLFGKGLKLLILGYKQFRKGVSFYSEEVENKKSELSRNMLRVLMGFDVVSFDNLSLKQLDVKKYMTPEAWKEFYMGDDGKFTMYIDLVEQKYAKCSVSTDRYDLTDDIEQMFSKVKLLD